MKPDVLKTSVDNGIAVVTLGSANRIFLDQEMTDALTTALEELAGDPGVRVVVRRRPPQGQAPGVPADARREWRDPGAARAPPARATDRRRATHAR